MADEIYIPRIRRWGIIEGIGMKESIVKLGTKTIFGEIVGVKSDEYERLYFCKDKYNTISLVPESVLKNELTLTEEK